MSAYNINNFKMIFLNLSKNRRDKNPLSQDSNEN